MNKQFSKLCCMVRVNEWMSLLGYLMQCNVPYLNVLRNIIISIIKNNMNAVNLLLMASYLFFLKKMTSQLLNQLQKGQICFFGSWDLLMSVRMFFKCGRLNFPWPEHPGIISRHPLFHARLFSFFISIQVRFSFVLSVCQQCLSLQIFHSVGCSKSTHFLRTAHLSHRVGPSAFIQFVVFSSSWPTSSDLSASSNCRLIWLPSAVSPLFSLRVSIILGPPSPKSCSFHWLCFSFPPSHCKSFLTLLLRQEVFACVYILLGRAHDYAHAQRAYTLTSELTCTPSCTRTPDITSWHVKLIHYLTVLM